MEPKWVRLVLETRGIDVPEIINACELGFGWGLSINLHAASSKINWYGTDYNAEQAAWAQKANIAAGAGAKLFNQSFADFCKRTDLPDFEYICLHGIWSWVDDVNRVHIVDFIRKKLKPGGVFYISYDVMPGLAAFLPLRDLLYEFYLTQTAAEKKAEQGAKAALDIARKLVKANSNYIKANPSVEFRLQQVENMPLKVLLGSYFAQSYFPMNFYQIAKWLEPAGLEYVCPAEYDRPLDDYLTSGEQKELLDSAPSQPLRESLRDYMRNQNFRKDIWVKEVSRLSTEQRQSRLSNTQLISLKHFSEFKDKLATSRGEATVNPKLMQIIRQSFANGHISSVSDIFAKCDDSVKFDDVFKVLTFMMQNSQLIPVNDSEVVNQVQEHCLALNRFLIKNKEVDFFASPLAGGIMNTDLYNKILMRIVLDNKQEQLWPRLFLEEITKFGGKFIIDGETVDTEKARLEISNQIVQNFTKGFLPVLRWLKVVDK